MGRLGAGALYFALTLCIAAVAAGAFFAVSTLLKRRMFQRLTVRLAEGEPDCDSSGPRAERRWAILKWSLYWFVVLAVYLVISVIFKSLTMYAFYLVLAAINCAVRLIISRPFRRFFNVRAKRVTVHLLNLFSVLVLAGLYLFIIENGSEYNNGYLDSLDYSVFEHNSSFTYDWETDIYTVSGAGEEFRILQLTDIHICASITTIGTDRRAFADAQAALENNDPDAVCLFGENQEQVSCPAQDSGFFDTILQKGSTQAVFVGHDHLNNMGIRYRGVDLVYSKSIDYYAYPGISNRTEQRGATLITLFPDAAYQIEQLDYIG